MRGEGATGRGRGDEAVLPDIDPGLEDEGWDGAEPDLWVERLRDALAERSPEIRGIAEQALRACPTDPAACRQADRDPGAPPPAAGSARSTANPGTAALGGRPHRAVRDRGIRRQSSSGERRQSQGGFGCAPS